MLRLSGICDSKSHFRASASPSRYPNFHLIWVTPSKSGKIKTSMRGSSTKLWFSLRSTSPFASQNGRLIFSIYGLNSFPMVKPRANTKRRVSLGGDTMISPGAILTIVHQDDTLWRQKPSLQYSIDVLLIIRLVRIEENEVKLPFQFLES